MTNATRAGPESHAPTPATLLNVYIAAVAGASHTNAGDTAALPTLMACKKPETMLRSPVGTSHNTDNVPRMYAAAISGAEITIALGRSRRGFAVSSPIVDESSSPANANAMDAQRLSVERSVTSGTSFAAVNALTLGCVTMASTPRTMSTTPGRYVATPPMLCNHFPVPSPTMFSAV